MSEEKAILEHLERLAAALDRLAPPPPLKPDFGAAEAFVWQASPEAFLPVPHVNRQPLGLLKGIDGAAEQLLDNTRRFARGLPANNALLWGARGMGKSSLVKAAQAEVRQELGLGGKGKPDLKLVEIHREDIASLPACLAYLRAAEGRFIVFCDDLSFDKDDTSYKSLKAVLEGGIEGRPENVLFYATSNRRHLMPREMMENERSTAINPSEAVEEKVSLSDRFGLWLGFHNATQDAVPRHGAQLRGPPRARRRRRRARPRGAGVGDDARRPIGPRRLAVHPGPGGTAGPAAVDRCRI